MTSTAKQLTAFVGVLALLFAAGLLAGRVIDAKPVGGDAHAKGSTVELAHGTRAATTSSTTAHPSAAPDAVRGLAVAENGLRIVVDDPELARGRTEQLRFRIVDERGGTVRDFDVEHTKRMHVIVARRDLARFQHLHPAQDPDGSWTTPLRLANAGSYRVFADFERQGEATTLAADLHVPGSAELQPLPATRRVAQSDGGHDVRLSAPHANARASTDLRFTVTRDGKAVHTEPYLGAGGHLVALREGDLAFLHVHPSDDSHESAGADDGVAFSATFPAPGRYRLFLQFQHKARVQTVAFTIEAK